MAIDKWITEKTPPDLGDPYSDWFLGEGKPFRVTEREPKETDLDYQFEFVAGTADRFRRDAVLVAPGHASAISQAVRMPAPLQARSVVSAGTNPSTFTERPVDLTAPAIDPPGAEVIVAVIDDGTNFGHECLRASDQTSTRVQFAWVQDGAKQPHSHVPFGREWTKPQIDAAIGGLRANASPDELLQALDLVDFTRFGIRTVSRRMSHGTHMTDLATGYCDRPNDPPLQGIDPDKIAVITVQLPFIMTQESSGATYEAFVVSALRYVLDRARHLSQAAGKPLPLVVNFSYAIAGGPHNGQSNIDAAFEALLNEHRADPNDGGTLVVMPSGNRYMERGHAEYVADSAGAAGFSLPWRVLPGDQTCSFVEIWMPVEATGTLTVQPPFGSKVTYTIGANPIIAQDGGQTVARLSTDVMVGHKGASRKRVLIAIAPTDTSWIGGAAPPSPVQHGVWSLQITADLQADDIIDAWIQRDESPYLYRANALQSYFDDEGYQRFTQDLPLGPNGDVAQSDAGSTSCVKRNGTLSGLATLDHPGVLIVGGRFGRTDTTAKPITPSLYSAEGFAVSRGGKSRPDMSAVADRSRVLSGVLAAGTASGSRVSVTGTSNAAPQIARWCAEEICRHRSALTKPISQAVSQGIVSKVKSDAITRHAVRSGDPLRLGY